MGDSIQGFVVTRSIGRRRHSAVVNEKESARGIVRCISQKVTRGLARVSFIQARLGLSPRHLERWARIHEHREDKRCCRAAP